VKESSRRREIRQISGTEKDIRVQKKISGCGRMIRSDSNEKSVLVSTGRYPDFAGVSKVAGMVTLIGAYNRSEVITVTQTACLSNPKDGSAKDW
jgi:hypothetical protein